MKLEELKKDLLIQRGELLQQKTNLEISLHRIDGALSLIDAQIQTEEKNEVSQPPPNEIR